jgi:hypothetical protein
MMFCILCFMCLSGHYYWIWKIIKTNVPSTLLFLYLIGTIFNLYMLKILQLFLYFMANNFLCTNYFFVNSFFEGSWFCIHCCLLIFHISIFSKIIGPITTKLGRNVLGDIFKDWIFLSRLEIHHAGFFFKWQALFKEFQNFMFITYIWAIYTL